MAIEFKHAARVIGDHTRTPAVVSAVQRHRAEVVRKVREASFSCDDWKDTIGTAAGFALDCLVAIANGEPWPPEKEAGS